MAIPINLDEDGKGGGQIWIKIEPRRQISKDLLIKMQ